MAYTLILRSALNIRSGASILPGSGTSFSRAPSPRSWAARTPLPRSTPRTKPSSHGRRAPHDSQSQRMHPRRQRARDLHQHRSGSSARLPYAYGSRRPSRFRSHSTSSSRAESSPTATPSTCSRDAGSSRRSSASCRAGLRRLQDAAHRFRPFALASYSAASARWNTVSGVSASPNSATPADTVTRSR